MKHVLPKKHSVSMPSLPVIQAIYMGKACQNGSDGDVASNTLVGALLQVGGQPDQGSKPSPTAEYREPMRKPSAPSCPCCMKYMTCSIPLLRQSRLGCCLQWWCPLRNHGHTIHELDGAKAICCLLKVGMLVSMQHRKVMWCSAEHRVLAGNPESTVLHSEAW